MNRSELLIVSLLFCHVKGVKFADQQHIRVIYSRLMERPRLQVCDDEGCEAVIVVVIYERSAVFSTSSGPAGFPGTAPRSSQKSIA